MAANSIAWAVLFSCLLITASAWDIRKRIIPDTLSLAIAAVGLVTFTPVKLLGILPAATLLIAALCFEGGIGGGDIKLAAACGFVLGFPAATAGLIMGMVVAVLYYIPFHLTQKHGKGQAVKQMTLPLVPFLSIGYIAATIIEIIGGTTL